MVTRNSHFDRLAASYLFPEIQKRVKSYRQGHPEAKILSLGIGDTALPLPRLVAEAMENYSLTLSTPEGYQGYGPEQGNLSLREKIAEIFYRGKIHPDEIFISDGAKCDLARLQLLFGTNVRIAVQDPAYPVYVDTSILMQGKMPVMMPCHPENDFFPSLDKLPEIDLIIFCSPHNPTGCAATHAQLSQLVRYALDNRCILLFDAAYSAFIRSPSIPRSIYEIPDAEKVAIEIQSFSKLVGFTGVRLGWTVVPNALCYEGGNSVHADWNRIQTTCFNGASRISQQGGIAALSPDGIEATQKLVAFYQENTSLLREVFEKKGHRVYGGKEAPFLWVKGKETSSWSFFQNLLEKKHIITTPGCGFGPSGEGFIRVSAFGTRPVILEAIKRLSHE